MAEDWLEILTRFHREVVLPDIKRVFGELHIRGLREDHLPIPDPSATAAYVEVGP